MSYHRAAAGWALVVLLSFSSSGQSPDPGPAPPTHSATRSKPITSGQRNFIITDMPGPNALGVAVWAETMKEAFESAVGARIPSQRIYPLIISARQSADIQRGWVESHQYLTREGNLRQELVMVNPALIDQEDVLELLCRFMLDRRVFARMDKSGDPVIPEMPGWLAVGIAQQLYPDLRARNIRQIRNLVALDKRKPDAITVFDWQYFPSGRWPEKALAGVVLEWIREQYPVDRLVNRLADARAKGEPVSGATIAGLLGYETEREFNMNFDVWLARQKNKIMPGVYEPDLAEVEKLLTLPSTELGLIWPGGATAALTPELLVENRDESWVRVVARSAEVRMRLALITQPPEASRALDGIMTCLRELGQGARINSNEEWLNRWRASAAALDRHKEQRQKIDAVVDAALLPPFTVEPGDRAALEEMMDRIEQQ